MLSGILQIPEVKEVLLSSRYFNVISNVIRSELVKAVCTCKSSYGGCSGNLYGVI